MLPTPKPYQIEDAKRALQMRHVFLGHEMGLGKGLPISHILPTIDGMGIGMKDIRVGDKVIGSNGKPTTVTGVYLQGLQQIYRIHFWDGSFVDCDGSHLWYVRDYNGSSRLKKYGSEYQILSTNDLLNRKLTLAKGSPRWHLPLPSAPIQFRAKKLPIDPYVMGIILAEGYIGEKAQSVIVSIGNLDRDILTRLPPGGGIQEKQGCVTKRIKGAIGIIRSLGICALSAQKRIPREYLLGSLKQRLDLLHGMMDGDGGVSRNRVTFSTVSPILAEQVKTLVASLAGIAKIRTYDRTSEGKGVEYQVNIKTFFNPFWCKRKSSKWKRPVNSHGPKRTILRIEELAEKEQTVCITVDAKDKLFLCGPEFVVTHNTLIATLTIRELSIPTAFLPNILIICPASLRPLWKWYMEAIRLPAVSIQEGNDALALRDFTGGAVICSYDLASMRHVLQNLVRFKWDIVVFDEAHYLSNPGADRTCCCLKNLFPLAKRTVFCSGTPIKDKPENIWAVANTICPDRFPTYQGFLEEFCTLMGDDNGRTIVRPGTVDQLKSLGRELKSRFLIRRSKKEVLPELEDKEYEIVPLICEELNTAIAAQDFMPEAEKLLEAGKNPREGSEIASRRKMFGVWKVPLIAEYVHTKLEGGLPNCVIFCWHKEVLSHLARFLRQFRVVTVQGGDSQAKREKAKELFQAGKAQIFLCTFAAAEGITLTAANHLFFAEMSWAADQNAQAEDRIHRIGQKDTCFIKYLLMQNSFDEIVYRASKQKSRAINHVMGA